MGLKWSRILPWIGLGMIAVAVVMYDDRTPFPVWPPCSPSGARRW